MAQIVKNLPAVQQTRVQSPVQEDPLEKGTPTHSTILAWRIPWTKEPGRLQSKGLQRVGHEWATNTVSERLTFLQDHPVLVTYRAMSICWDFFFFFFPFIFISWRLITLQYCSGFCHTLTWISHGVTGIPHPDPPSHLPLYPIPLGFPSAPGPSTCLMHPYVGTSMAGGSVKQGLRDANIWTS